MALAEAKIVEQVIKDVYTINFDYLQMNEVMKIIKDDQLTVLNQQFDNICSITLAIRKMQINQVILKLESITGLTCKLVV